MKTLDQHISEFLYSTDKVTVPGFGTFIRQEVRSLHDSHAHSIRPPRSVIGFNPHLTKGDALVKKVSETERITLEKAHQFISDTVAAWRERLKKNAEVKIANVGRVVLSGGGQYRFVQQVGINHSAKAFGMPSYVLKSVNQKKNPIMNNKPQAQKVEKSTASQKKENRTPVILYLGIVVAALSLLGAVGYYLLDSLYSNTEAQVSESIIAITSSEGDIAIDEENVGGSEEDSNTDYPSENMTNNTVSETTTESTTSSNSTEELSLSENTPHVKKKASRSRATGYFALIILSTPNKAEAKSTLALLKDKGYDSFIAGSIRRNGKKYFRIGCARSKSKREILSLRSKLRGDYPDAWVTRMPR